MNRRDLIASLNPETVAEIGVCEGEFSQELLTIPTIRKLYLIDPWKFYPGSYEKDPANVDQAGQDQRFIRVRDKFERDSRVSLIREESLTASARFYPLQLDVAFLDAQHDKDSVIRDLIAWKSRARFLAVHDYTDRPEALSMGFGTVSAVEFFCNQFDWKISTVTDEEWPTVLLVHR